jgi:hypothetical protein
MIVDGRGGNGWPFVSAGIFLLLMIGRSRRY